MHQILFCIFDLKWIRDKSKNCISSRINNSNRLPYSFFVSWNTTIICWFVFQINIIIGVAQWVRSLDLTTRTSLSPIQRGFSPGFVNNKKGCTQLAAASDKVYQLLAYGRWFSPASSTTKTGCHDIAEILLKVALKHQKSKSNR